MFRRLYAYLPELVALPRPLRRLLVVGTDLALCCGAVWIAFWLRLGEWDWISWPLLTFMALANVAWLVAAALGGTYKSVVRFSGRHTVFRLIPVFFGMSLLLGAVLMLAQFPGIPRTLSVLHPLVLFLGVTASRLTVAQLLLSALHLRTRHPNCKRVLIYGAGSAGRQLAQSMRQEPGMTLMGFVDDNEALKGRFLEGRRIWHSSELEGVLAREDVNEVFLAMPTARRGAKRAIVDRLNSFASQISVRALPSLSQIAFDHVSVTDLREVQIEELLGRDEVTPHPELLAHDIFGKCVLVTGAGGSIGSELSRQILRQLPARLILADQAEHSLYLIDTELREFSEREGLATEIVADLADVADERDCARLFAAWQPETVFHAAAYKHVPLVEANRLSGIRNNVLGTVNAALNAERAGAGKFVLISTDKAVRPTNIMGASKRACELIIQARAAAQNTTTFTAVRFGNVLGSSGSVVPRFREQIARGGPITLTHRDVTRFFMTIPEASQLVIQAGAMAEGGEVFLLDMGQPVRIYDLAKSMVELSGLSVRDQDNPDGDIDIVETGLRPGEKLFEELLISADSLPTDHPRIVCAKEQMVQWDLLKLKLSQLRSHIEQLELDAAVDVVRGLVPGYAPRREAEVISIQRKVASGR